MIDNLIEFFLEKNDYYFTVLTDHIKISVFSLLIAICIALPFAYYCSTNEKINSYMTKIFNVLRIIPSLAVLIFLIPIMGTGIKPAMFALVLLAIPAIFMNSVAGFTSTPDFMIETAKAIGLNKRQIRINVVFQYAIPYILIGIKIAFIEIISSATLAAYIGAGGLGEIIYTGLGLLRMDLVMIGGLSVAFLSVMSSLLLSIVQRKILSYKYIDR